MGNVIRVDFRRERKKETDAFKAFEEAMRKHEQARRFKTAGIMVLFSFIIIATMALPFGLEYIGISLF